jgi:competence protein ComEA
VSEEVGGGASTGGLVNVNTATPTDLETLPGVGEVIAQAIVDYRTQNGPFSSVDQLLDVSGIGDATLEDIRELVTV